MPPLLYRASGLFFSILMALAVPTVRAGNEASEESSTPESESRTVSLVRGPEDVRFFSPDNPSARAIVVFGSGDGGWSPVEETMAGWLQKEACIVVGLDFAKYAKTDYSAETLGSDMALLAGEGQKIAGEKATQLPVIYAGWSMGAVQAVAGAAWKDRPQQLKGLLIFSAGSRGRYGLRDQDRIGISPTGAGTFGLMDFKARMQGLRVAQFNGSSDFMSSSAWIRNITSPKAFYLIPGANHGFNELDDDFATEFPRGLNWVLGDESSAPRPAKTLPWGLSPLWPGAAIAIVLAAVFLFSRRHSMRVLFWAVEIMGVINILEALVIKPPEVIDWIQQWLPLGVRDDSRLLLLFCGLCLVLMGRGLRRRKHIAWLGCLILLSSSIVIHLVRAFDWHHALAAFVLLLPLIRWRKEFLARSDRPSLRFATAAVPVFAVALFIYAAVSLHQLGERSRVHEPLDWSQCLQGAASAVFLQSSHLDLIPGEIGELMDQVRTASLIAGLLVTAVMLRPVLAARLAATSAEDREEVAQIMTRHGADPMDSFSLLDDKRYYFNPDRTGVIAYALWRKYAVALADPIGPAVARHDLIAGFAAFCASQDWEPVFYCAHVSRRPLYEETGFITLKIGEDARLQISDFKLEGSKFQNLRTARNKGRKNGLSHEWYDAQPRPDHGLEAQLTLLSQEWLEGKAGSEMTFDLGSFNLSAIRTHGASIIRNAEGRMEAFATWLPYAQGKGRCLDLMRTREEVRDVMDFLIVEAIDHFKEQGVEEISLGNAPLANINAEGPSALTREERAVHFIFENSNRFYGYKSLFNFKKKYHPTWQGRYVAYKPGTPLPMVGLAVAGVHLPRGFRSLWKS